MNVNAPVNESIITLKRKRSENIITDSPNNMELETYISNYKGRTKIDRLLFIAERCPTLRTDAYKLALTEIKTNTLDVNRYSSVLTKLNGTFSEKGEDTIKVDTTWIDTTQKEACSLKNKLEAEYTEYNGSLTKESSRMKWNKLGDYFYACGDINNALKCYSRTREYCTTALHTIDMCLNIIKACIELGQLSNVHSYVAKAKNASGLPDKDLVMAKFTCAQALAHLDGNDADKYKQAANLLLEIPFEFGSQYNEVISPSDIAVYGGLCALASFDRVELKRKVINNSEFKNFLGLEQHIYELIHSFYYSRYKDCFQILDTWKGNFLLDYHLHSHVEILYSHIRRKALIQYSSPFLTVDLVKMASSLFMNLSCLERELGELIRDGQVKARIDTHMKILHATCQDQYSQILEKSLSIGTEYEKTSRAMLLQINLIKANMMVL